MNGMNADQAREFEEEIGMRPNPVRDAREALLEYQKAAGIVIENPDAPVGPDAKGLALAADEEIGGSWMGDARHGTR